MDGVVDLKGCGNTLQRCVRCGCPETYETLEFDADGVCNICKQRVFRDTEINWEERRAYLDKVIEEVRGKHDYDCIVPFSGGKDTTFTLYKVVKELQLKPLVVQFNHGFFRPKLLENNQRTLKQLGVDFISFTPNWKVVKALMLESLIRKGDFCWHCHSGITAYPMQIAVKFGIPLLFWGEPPSEYTTYYDYRSGVIHEMDETIFNRVSNLGLTAQDMNIILREKLDLDPRDLHPYIFPSARDLKQAGIHSFYLGSFFPWDVRKQVELINEKIGWQGDEVEGMPPGMYRHEKIECYMQGVRDYIKFIKRGYSRVTQMTALDVRHNRMSPNEARQIVEKFDGRKPHSLSIFLNFLGLTENEFNDIVLRTVVEPHRPKIEEIPTAEKVADSGDWYSEPFNQEFREWIEKESGRM
jgi:N-acetyl sugar amidotransferase